MLWNEQLFFLFMLDEKSLLVMLNQSEFPFSDILKSPTVIKHAAIAGCFDLVEFLFNNGAPADMIDLKLIAASGNEKCMELASRRVKECEHEPKAFTFSDFARFRYLTEEYLPLPYLFEIPMDLYFVPLYHAIRRNRECIIELLLENGADPCQRLNYQGRYRTPLEEAFYLPSSTVEMVVKYAVLQVGVGGMGLKKFYAQFKVYWGRSFFKFARLCVAEVNRMRGVILKTCEVTLYCFIVSRDETLKVLLEDSEIVRNVFNILASASFPIYNNMIGKKLEKNCILNALCELSTYLRWSSNPGDISLDNLCVINIFSFLCKEDLVNLWIALQ